jgi:cobalt-zinc-cadmium efflux system outer membrane protein
MLFAGLIAAGLTAALSLDEAVSEALSSAPARAASQALEARRPLDADLPWLSSNPTFQLQVGTRSPAGGPSGYESEWWVYQPIALGDHAKARRDAAKSEAAALGWTASEVRLAMSRAAAAAWFESWGARARWHRAVEEDAVAKSLVAKTDRARTLGGAIALDVDDARAYAAEASLALLEAEGLSFEADVTLARTLGREAAGPVATRDELPAVVASCVADDEALVGRASRLPMVRAAEARVRADLMRLEEATSGKRGQVTVGASLTLDAGGPGTLVSVAASPPIVDRAQRERAGLSADVELARGEAARARAEAVALLRRALHEVAHSREVLDGLTTALVPALEARVVSRERLLAGGEGGLPELLRARRERLSGLARLDEDRVRHAAAAWHWRLLSEASNEGER